MLVTAGKDIEVSKDGVVMHLAWVAGWVVEKLHGLVAAMARVEGIARFSEAEGDLEDVTGEGRELVTAVDGDVDIIRLDTAIDVVVVVVVVVGVDEVAVELAGKELASALRAWKAAARFLSF